MALAAERLAEFVAKNGPAFEEMTRERNPGETPFKCALAKELTRLDERTLTRLRLLPCVLLCSGFCTTPAARGTCTTSTVWRSARRRRREARRAGLPRLAPCTCARAALALSARPHNSRSRRRSLARRRAASCCTARRASATPPAAAAGASSAPRRARRAPERRQRPAGRRQLAGADGAVHAASRGGGPLARANFRCG